ERLDRYAQSGDAVVFHAHWQIGYFKSHYRGEPVTTYTLDEVKSIPPPPSLLSHKRIWLAMYDAGRNDPRYSSEGWLDLNWVRLNEWQVSRDRLMLYVPVPQGEWKPVAVEFQDAAREPVLQLTGVRLSSTGVTAGDAISVALQWRPAKDLSQRYTVFLHLLDSRNRHVAGHDSEPLAGLSPISEWKSGSVVEDRIGLMAPIDLPQGDYRLVMGLYPTGSPDGTPRLSGVGLSGPGNTAVLGTIRVERQAIGRMKPYHALTATFDERLELFGYETDLDPFQIEREQTVHPLPEESILLTFPRVAYRIGETINLKLYWKSLASIAEDYHWRLELVDEGNQVRATAEGLLLRREDPTSAWHDGDLAVTEHRLKLNEGVPAGTYRLRVSLLRPPDLQRATLIADGTKSDVLVLGEAEVR
ncbi:MAG: hypothetical protein ABIH46_11790, partial [Chloroflexota bacterium]